MWQPEQAAFLLCILCILCILYILCILCILCIVKNFASLEIPAQSEVFQPISIDLVSPA